MDLYVLNLDLEDESIIDSYKSLIWTDRYNEYGDFEIYTAMSSEIFNIIRQDYYLRRPNSDHVMIIEKLQISSDAEDGNMLVISGRSLESILDRRIVWGQKTISGNLQEGIKTLLTENVISPSNTNRKIENFIFEDSDDPEITGLTIEAQYTGDNLYEVIQKICQEKGIGFRIYVNENKQFVFKLYAGTDRSYNQLERPYVVFSPSFDNLISSNYIESKTSFKNVTLVGGEGEGSARRYTAVGNASGLNRREIFTDARDISSSRDDGSTISNTEYIAQLRQRGKETLSENIEVKTFEGDADTSSMFKYNEDFFIGDIVQVANEYGQEITARIVELVASDDESGITVYPTFLTIEANKLPENYLQLDYIESSGTQYIKTGVMPDQNTRVTMKVEMVSQSNTAVALFGVRDQNSATATLAYCLWSLGTGTSVRSDYFGDSVSASLALPSLSTFEVDCNKNVCKINEVVLSHAEKVGESAHELYLFTSNNAGSVNASYHASMRLHSCKIYEDGILIRDFVPCKNESDIPGLYDLVNEVFYKNAGTGGFITE